MKQNKELIHFLNSSIKVKIDNGQILDLVATNLIVIDREWLENEIERTKSGIYDAHLILKAVRDKSYPLTPILEDTWENEFNAGIRLNKNDIIGELKQSYLTQPITLSKK